MEGLIKLLTQIGDLVYYGIIGVLIILALIALLFWNKERY